VKRETEKLNDGFGQIVGWIIFGCGLLILLLYSLSFFIGKPTVETITTHAPAANTQNEK